MPSVMSQMFAVNKDELENPAEPWIKSFIYSDYFISIQNCIIIGALIVLCMDRYPISDSDWRNL